MHGNIVFKAEWNNFGELNSGLDEICSEYYCFYEDLTVEMSVGYTSSGKSEVKSIVLTKEQFHELKSLINSEYILPHRDNARGMCDGEEWNFTLYSETNEEIKCDHVSTYGIIELTNLANYLKSIADLFSFSSYGENSYTRFFR